MLIADAECLECVVAFAGSLGIVYNFWMARQRAVAGDGEWKAGGDCGDSGGVLALEKSRRRFCCPIVAEALGWRGGFPAIGLTRTTPKRAISGD